MRVKAKILSQGTKRKRDDVALDDDPSGGKGASDLAVGVNYTSSYGVSESLANLQSEEHAEYLALKSKKARLDAGEKLSDIDGTGEGLNDGLYHGEKAYGNVLGKRDETAKPRAQRIGPQRNMNSTIRTVTMIDYQPDVCKDYKGEGLEDPVNYRELTNYVTYRNWILRFWRYVQILARSRDIPPRLAARQDRTIRLKFHHFCHTCRTTQAPKLR